MYIRSSAFEHDQPIPVQYTCDGDNVSPPLQIGDVPKGAKSLVIIFDDPDADAGVWTHWVVAGLDPKTTELPEGHLPKDVTLGKTSFGDATYGGPCPTLGVHHYVFRLYALDTDITIPEGSQRETLEEIMAGNILDKAELMGTYKKQ